MRKPGRRQWEAGDTFLAAPPVYEVASLATDDAATMLALAELLDIYNNGECPPDEEEELAPGRPSTLTTHWGE